MRLFAFLLYLSLFGPTTALANEPTALTATPDKSAGKTTKSKNPKSLLSPELEKFLGKNSLYEKEYKKSGKEFATALQASNPRPRLEKLLRLGHPFRDHALYALALEEQKQKNWAKAFTHLSELSLLPDSPWREAAADAMPAVEFSWGMKLAAEKKTTEAIAILYRAMQRLSWREWENREPELQTLWNLMKEKNHPLLSSLENDLVSALGNASTLRATVVKSGKGTDRLARYRGPVPPSGVKNIQPDTQAFEEAFTFILKKDWEEAVSRLEKAVVDFPQSEINDRMRYWIAHGYQEQDEEKAQKIFEEIFRENPLSYYGLMSALQLKKDLKNLIGPSQDLSSIVFEGDLLSRQQHHFFRLRALLELGLGDYARREAASLASYRAAGFAIGQSNPAAALQFARLLHSAGYHMGAFTHAHAALSLDRNLYFPEALRLIFPEAFLPEVEKVSSELGLHPFLVLSLTKQESAFQRDAISRSDALGLMQLLPSTAKDLDRNVERLDLFEPEKNLRLGSQYLRKLLDRFQGNIALALAGYNAGPSRAQQWQKKFLEQQEFRLEFFVDSIPFTETRRYVSSILRNYLWYKMLAGESLPASLEELNFQWQKIEPKINPPNSPAPQVIAPPTAPQGSTQKN